MVAARSTKLRHRPHGTRRQSIVESLLADVFHGRFRTGERLVTEDLAARFGVSHTPIREALIALAGIGIVDLKPNRGAIVKRISATEVREVAQVRRALECAATRTACGRIQHSELITLAEELRRLLCAKNGSAGDFIAEARSVDSRLHDLIASSCGNSFLAAELTRLKLLFRAFRDVSWAWDEARNDFHRLAEEAHEHLAIVEALIAGKPHDAAAAMSRHIRSGVRYWTRSVPANGANGKNSNHKDTKTQRKQGKVHI